ncbi:MAG: TlpA disulfide reductase family protein [Nocardioides sp.]
MTRPAFRARAAGIVTSLLVASSALTACSPDEEAAGGSSVEVVQDTAELRELKAESGIEPCAPGSGSGGELPALTLPCLGGGADVDLSELTGPLVISLWASNCAPCRDEMPALQQFYEKHGATVGLLGIDAEIDSAFGISFAQLVGATYPQLADPAGDLFSQSELRVSQALPQFILVDDVGDVVHQSAGGFDTLAEIERYVATNLGVDL